MTISAWPRLSMLPSSTTPELTMFVPVMSAVQWPELPALDALTAVLAQ